MKLAEQTLEHWTELAMQIANRIHAGQHRSNGRPYLEHCARVAEKVEPRLKPIAWLHDTVEDHPDKISIEELKKTRISDLHCRRSGPFNPQER